MFVLTKDYKDLKAGFRIETFHIDRDSGYSVAVFEHEGLTYRPLRVDIDSLENLELDKTRAVNRIKFLESIGVT